LAPSKTCSKKVRRVVAGFQNEARPTTMLFDDGGGKGLLNRGNVD